MKENRAREPSDEREEAIKKAVEAGYAVAVNPDGTLKLYELDRRLKRYVHAVDLTSS